MSAIFPSGSEAASAVAGYAPSLLLPDAFLQIAQLHIDRSWHYENPPVL